MPLVHALIQARMSSKRFPGKVLAPLAGTPLIKHLVDRVSEVVELNNITILTSEYESDDPLAYYAKEMGWNVHRGPLENVYLRFHKYLKDSEIRWFFRICADSPLLKPKLLEKAVSMIEDNIDIITNVKIRTFPSGQSVELVNANTFLNVDVSTLSNSEQEHVTEYFYKNEEKFILSNFESTEYKFDLDNYAVDNLKDIDNLEIYLNKPNRN